MAEIKLEAETREEFGKGAARRTRRAGRIPAVIYGHGTDPVHISLPAHATALALRQANVLLEIELPGAANLLALPKQVQRDPIRDSIEHVDLIIVKRGEKVTVEVQLVVSGDVVAEGIINQDRTYVAINAEATHIPNEIDVSVEGLEIGSQVTLGDLVLPTGAELAEDPELLVLSINATRAAIAEAEAGAETAEGETAAAEAAE
ncbi:MAG: 50S ribosomal protein L25/general stress protein Ctc [Propionibacteriaceae bacterium]|jgi:large subunit ribosomal protein L25|nr:50S ribosomal protein L25/general stress protein Ctc [Propionibacteriaceae bacterium]